jgi:hypothetical protein
MGLLLDWLVVSLLAATAIEGTWADAHAGVGEILLAS